MKPLILLKTTTSPLLVSVLLVCLGLWAAPNTFGVSPAPDGGYPGGNTAEGTNALFSLTTGVWNTALGFEALSNDIAGKLNTATGFRALFSDTSGSNNTATGVYALYGNTTGGYNTAIGTNALSNNTGGSSNTANGYHALFNNTTGIGNTALGTNAGSKITTANNVIAIGSSGANRSGSCFIGHIRGVMPANANTVQVVIDSAGQLGTPNSSRRFKKEIKPMDSASESILALKPVTFHYKSDAAGTPQFGLIAEEVAEVNPDLVVRDEDGEIYTVRYDAVNAMLLNEFLKDHRKVQEQHRKIQQQEATITELKSTVVRQEQDLKSKIAEQQKDFQSAITRQQKEMETVVAHLKEQDSKIQKVSDQLEVSKPAAQIVLNNH
jgi:hypothetical protein